MSEDAPVSREEYQFALRTLKEAEAQGERQRVELKEVRRLLEEAKAQLDELRRPQRDG